MAKSASKKSDRPVRMVDVARLAGVSLMTVSGAFREAGDDYSVAPKTRERVLAAAAKLGYRPNSMARAIRRQQFRNIGFLVVKTPHYLWLLPSSLAGVFDGLNDGGFHLSFIGLPPNFDAASHVLPKSFQEESIDALIVDNTLGISNETKEILSTSRFPVVHLNHRAKHNAVWIDDEQAMTQAVQHVVAKGYRKPAFFAFQQRMSDQHYSYDTRRMTCARCLTEAGLPARELIVSDRPAGYAEAEAALRRRDRPDVLICYSDLDALFVQRVTTLLGLKIPDDLGLITFRGDAVALSPVPLTHMMIPWYEMGAEAARMALQLGAREARKILPAVRFEASLVEGDSL